MSRMNAIIGFPRWTDRASFSGGSWQAAWPLSNLKSLPLSRVARSTDSAAASTRFRFELDKPRPIGLFGFCRHNMTLPATFDWALYSRKTDVSPAKTQAGLKVWPPLFPTRALLWEDDNWWSGQYRQEELAGTNWTRAVWLEGWTIAEAGEVQIHDAGNPDGYVELGLFEIDQGWQVSTNMGYGARYGFQARTQVIEALGGVEYFDRRNKPRTFTGEIAYLDHDEALAQGFELQRQHDLNVPFLWMPTPADNLHWLRETYLARNAALDPVTLAARGFDSFPINIKEVL